MKEGKSNMMLLLISTIVLALIVSCVYIYFKEKNKTSEITDKEVVIEDVRENVEKNKEEQKTLIDDPNEDKETETKYEHNLDSEEMLSENTSKEESESSSVNEENLESPKKEGKEVIADNSDTENTEKADKKKEKSKKDVESADEVSEIKEEVNDILKDAPVEKQYQKIKDSADKYKASKTQIKEFSDYIYNKVKDDSYMVSLTDENDTELAQNIFKSNVVYNYYTSDITADKENLNIEAKIASHFEKINAGILNDGLNYSDSELMRNLSALKLSLYEKINN